MKALDHIIWDVYEWAMANDITWKIGGSFRRPTHGDVTKLLESLVEQVSKQKDSISIETAGILVKRTDDRINVYTMVGKI